MARVRAGASKTQKRIRPGDQVTIRLSRRERELVLNDTFLGGEVADRLRVARVEGNTVAVRLTPDELDEILGYVAAAANHAESPKMQKALDHLYGRLAEIEQSCADRSADSLAGAGERRR